MLSQFKELVDRGGFPDVFKTGSLENQYKALDLPLSTGLTINKVMETLSERINNALDPSSKTGSFPQSFFAQLRKVLVYDIILHQTGPQYLVVSEAIQHSLRKKAPYIALDQWQPAVNWALALVEIQKKTTTLPISTLRSQHPREVDNAFAIQRLSARGCTIQWENGEIVVEQGLEQLTRHLESLVKEISGPVIMRNIFTRFLHKTYNAKVQRYLFSEVIPASPDQMKPHIPIGYLLNLAAKHPFERIITPTQLPDVNAKWKEMASLATDIFKILDLQPYNIWEKALRTSDDLIQGLYNTIISDAAARIPQSNPTMEMEMLPVLFDWVDRPEFVLKTGFELDHYLSVAQAVVNITSAAFGPQLLFTSTVQSQLTGKNIPAIAIASTLRIMAHQPAEVNQGYTKVTDSNLINAHKKPLVQLNQTTFILYDRSWTAMGFYESLAEQARLAFDTGKEPGHQHTDRYIGFALERYIRLKLNEHQISHQSGKFKDADGKDAECDIIIEGTQYLVIVEIKKKQLTAESRTGDMTSVFLDLNSSLLQSQVQAGKTDIMLRRDGCIKLTEKGKTQKINRNDRGLMRISLTHYDFDSLHDRQIAAQILTAFIEGTFSFSPQLSPKMKDGVEVLEKYKALWQDQYRTLDALDPKFSKNPFFSTWFLSTGQLLLLLEGTNNADQFIDNLRKTESVSLSSNNFYVEYLKGPNFDDSGAGIVLYTLPTV